MFSLLLIMTLAWSSLDSLTKDNARVMNFHKKQKISDSFNPENAFETMIVIHFNSHQVDNTEAYEHFFSRKYSKIKSQFNGIENSDNIISAIYLYSLLKLNQPHLYIHEWLKTVSNVDPFFVALDSIASKSFDKWLDRGLFIGFANNSVSLDYQINAYIYAMNSVNDINSIERVIVELEDESRLKLHLTKKLLYHYLQSQDYAKASSLIKEIYEPFLDNSKEVEDASFYYLSIARLYYQNAQFESAIDYYKLIPSSSDYYVNAQVELAWVYLKQKKYHLAKGQAQALNHIALKDTYLHDSHLVSAIVNLTTCQFLDAHANIDQFISYMTYWSTRLEKSPYIKKSNWYYQLLSKSLVEITDEMKSSPQLISIKKKRMKLLKNFETNSQALAQAFIKSQINKMKFIRVELLAQLRSYNKSKQLATSDSVSIMHSSLAKSDDLIFVSKGDIWGDEIFGQRINVKSNCRN